MNGFVESVGISNYFMTKFKAVLIHWYLLWICKVLSKYLSSGYELYNANITFRYTDQMKRARLVGLRDCSMSCSAYQGGRNKLLALRTLPCPNYDTSDLCHHMVLKQNLFVTLFHELDGWVSSSLPRSVRGGAWAPSCELELVSCWSWALWKTINNLTKVVWHHSSYL